MKLQELDLAPVSERTGFRLHRAELYNWGTFDGRVWSMAPGGESALLTGDNGSGKSTLVDALTTLLVPAHRITYNKAAGAEGRERSLRSYVLGHYKAEREETGGSARPVSLRDEHSFSVILGYFFNEGYGHGVTLAQVFWLSGSGQPERMHVIADRDLTIARDFSDFGHDIKNLRKRLREAPDIEVHDTFPLYGAAFRRRFGIEGEQALELFSQTVSMKSVGNLTDFVRSHMLEPEPVDERIDALIHHFDDLSRAHEAVIRARAQIEALEPLIADAHEHHRLSAEAASWRAAREALEPWFAGIEARLLEERRQRLDERIRRYDERIRRLDEDLTGQRSQREELQRAIAEQGGDRLEALAQQIGEHQREAERRRRNADAYNALAEHLGLSRADETDTFLANQQRLAGLREDAEARLSERQNERTELEVSFRELRSRHQELEQELESLRARRSNIPARMLELRQHLCKETGLDPDELPFAGELIQVHEEARDWEGAAERLLHNFGLSLLVPDRDYPRVAEWVDRTHLRGRLVYYRVRERQQRSPELHPHSLVRALAIRPDSGFYTWLEAELAERFDYACCDDLDTLRREQRAVTRAGQIKSGGYRHEKDDRHGIDDRSRFILGWSNEAKIAALERQAADYQTRMQELADRMSRLEQELRSWQEQIRALDKIEVYADFQELDWHSVEAEIQRLEAERERIQASSDRLRTLQEQRDGVEARIKELEQLLLKERDERSRLADRSERTAEALASARERHQAATETQRSEAFPLLDGIREEALAEQSLTVESLANAQSAVRGWVSRHIDNVERNLRRLADKVVSAMADFRHQWPLEAQEMDARVEAYGEYAALLDGLKSDDLPRFERRFRELLNENTLREIANFQAHLHRQRQSIRERISTINRSLHGIDFNPGRYIELLADPTQDAEIRDFQNDLRSCVEGWVDDDGEASEAESEARFARIRAIIERLRGREGTAEADRRWRRKVTDVRNWFTFSAEERWREDDAPYEHYTDSGGKSGGQKEKLAYTVLAASLAYQFGLDWERQRSRSFRFVLIDEAFGRGSDESARFGLELFQRLGLQLLVVTPLQKIHIIEPYVASVGLVSAPDGAHSKLRHIPIDEYRAEQADPGAGREVDGAHGGRSETPAARARAADEGTA
ncbi:MULTISPECIES: ATP-binding protein [unclassified Halorhodospira]|uniref:ATP-binding protein n=1 Tax=unclassified Halorhodospira TaxID=2626748 RepID=UPI001EE7AA4F|nr:MULTISPECIES: ATP-binding protein [unclassified Halorhodospira]MCG5541803.1 ATP-dependent exonuclease SbcCD, C subunit-like protein [Halorhodospira sp. M39old]MCG5546891.1 ATP-dependent exonuclease SbcCD, C subunit-like protein [Halorhodospira sp. M38]